MDAPLAETWLVNHRATLLLLANVTEKHLGTTLSSRGGRTVGQQFVHVFDVRLASLEAADPGLAREVARITPEEGHDQEKLIHALTTSAHAIAELIRRSLAAGGEIRGFKRGVEMLVGYLIAHEAHHRGHALLTLEQSGVTLADDVRFGIWNWDQL